MVTSTDLYLGAFLILCGFSLSLLNLRRLVKRNSSFPSVLISENVLLMCIGIAFVCRSIREMGLLNSDMQHVQERIAEIDMKNKMSCNFASVLLGYGPFIVSLVNSFLSLIIDNYMHYRLMANVKKEDEENTVQEFVNRSKIASFTFHGIWKKYFSYLAVGLQWVVPIVIALSMYPMEIKERFVTQGERSQNDFCMAMVGASNNMTCLNNLQELEGIDLRKFLPTSYIEVLELPVNDSVAAEINSVIKNVYQIVANIKNETVTSLNVTSAPIWRKGKSEQSCMKICYLDNKNLLLYMFVIAVVTYFVPITISSVILTKIHIMDVKRPGLKMYVSRELLYNILFWTPVMFDTFLSLLLCSYSMNGIKTSIFNYS